MGMVIGIDVGGSTTKIIGVDKEIIVPPRLIFIYHCLPHMERSGVWGYFQRALTGSDWKT